MQRRDFIVLAAAGSAATLTIQGCSTQGDYATPIFVANDKYVPGVDYWHATTCRECRAGCGLIARKRDGRVNKIDGNPLHPISAGKTCVRGQAALNRLYNPDRLKGPLRRKGERGRGEFQSISWDEAINSVAVRFNELIAAGRGSKISWLGGNAHSNSLNDLIARLMKACGAGTVGAYVPFSDDLSVETLDLSKADYLLSFGTRFLETWGSPVLYSRGYGAMREAGPGRHRFVHAEPRMSLTAANADRWLPVRPGTEGVLALAIASEIQRLDGNQGSSLITDEELTSTGIPARAIAEVARELRLAKAPVVIGGDSAAAHTNGSFILQAIGFLAGLLKTGQVQSRLQAEAAAAPKVLREIDLGPIFSGTELLLVHDANPVYSVPDAFQLRDALTRVPFIISFSSFLDETASLADLILPDHSPYESWGDDIAKSAPRGRVVSFAQPLIEPLYDTRHTGDILLGLAKQVPAMATAAASESFLDLLKTAHLTNPESEDAQARWDEAVVRGGVWDGPAPGQNAIGRSPATTLPVREPARFSGDEKDFPYHFLPYEHLALGDGTGANLPLLQELPDPMTNVSWGSWIELNPETAAKLGVVDGDRVAVESPHGRLEAPVVVYPGIRPDTVAMPCGQGHEVFGRYASGRGGNPLRILSSMTDSTNGALAWAATRVRLSKTGTKARVAHTGTNERLLEDRSYLKR
jgi:anaerobic selenocysteine-containing dehydrogenase